jgi:outer membrane protein insertion porin family
MNKNNPLTPFNKGEQIKSSPNSPLTKGDKGGCLKCWLILICILLTCQYSEAQDNISTKISDFRSSANWEKWQDLLVVDIQYKSDGDFPLEKVQSVTTIKIGDIFSRLLIKKSIENMYSIGEFSEVNVDAQLKGDGMALTFALVQQIKTRNIQLIGNRKLSRDDMLETLKLRIGQEYSESLAQSDVNAIRELYKFYGYFDTNVTYSTKIDDKTKEIDVTFTIIEGGQPVITEIIFTGTNEAVVESRSLLRAMKETKLGWTYKGQKVLDMDAKGIEDIYRQREYLTAKVKQAVALSDPKAIEVYDNKGRHFIAQAVTPEEMRYGKVTIVMEIEQGRRVYVKLNGNDSISDKEIKNAIALYRMRSVNESIIRRSREDIEKLYKSRGYYLVGIQYSMLKDMVWDFNDDNELNGWQSDNAAKTLEVSKGVLKVPDSTGLTSKVDIDTRMYQKAQVRMKVSSDTSGEAQTTSTVQTNSTGTLYWTTNKSKKWNQKKSQTFQVIVDNQFHDYEIPTYKSKNWSNTITQLRFVPVDVPNAIATIEWIKVTTEFIPVIFAITENKQMRITKPIALIAPPGKKLEINLDQIKKQMLTRKKSFFSFWLLKKYFPTGILDEDIFEEDIRAITAFYKDSGYTDPKITEIRETIPKKGEIDIKITIDEGQRTFVNEVDVEGNLNDVLKTNELFSNLEIIAKYDPQNVTEEGTVLRYKMDPPKPFREYDTVADRSYLSLQYADKGYIADVEPVMGELKNGIIRYKISPGKLMKLDGNVDIIGNERTKRYIIAREVSKTLTKDKIFSFTEIEKTTQNIRNLGLFNSVKTETQPIDELNNLYRLTINVQERDSKTVNLRAGYNSVEGFQGGIEANDINLFGTARRIVGRAQLGTQGTLVETEYAEPKMLSRILGPDAVGVVNLYPFTEYKDYNEKRKGGTAGVSWQILRLNTFKLDYRYDVLSYTLNNKKTATRIGRVEVLYQRDGRDNLLNPKKGTFEGLSFEYANPFIGGIEKFTKLSFNSMFYSRLFDDVVLALGLRTGYAWNLGGEQTLAPELFRMRDYQTPRGYNWEITDIGNVLLNTSLEIRFNIYKWIGAAIFFDSGQIYNGISDFTINSMRSSVGGGLRITTPIGPIRLDYGYPIRGNGKRRYLPEIAFGNSF